MALSTTSLPNNGQTPNFQVQYEDSLPNQANVIANAKALMGLLETEFMATTGPDWFNTPSGKFGTSHRQVVNLDRVSGKGASNSGYGSAISMDSQNTNGNVTNASGILGMIFINEWVEILMGLNGKWNAGDSSGEGLSQYSGIARFPTGHYNYYNRANKRLFVETWLNTHPHPDWVSKTEGTDGDFASFGCALAFIFYLKAQLNFPINQIIADGASNLAAVYRTLTGDTGDPYPLFSALLENAYPSSATATLPGPIFDNPFPLALLSFLVDKSTFGKDEVQDVINNSGGKWSQAFWLVVEGFSKNSFTALNVTIPAPTGAFATLPGISIQQNPNIDYENAANPAAPQRIRIPYDIVFTNAALANFPSSGSQTYELDASVSVGGTTPPAANASTQFELVAGADPYFTNVDPTQNNVFYLSQDLRVFTATPALNNIPVPGGPTFATDSVAGAYSYIQALLQWLNGPSNYSNPTGTDPFNSVLPAQGGALTGDSSVTPTTSQGGQTYNNYNFAVARVRLRGTAGPSGKASGVRMFFRVWGTQTADTDYQTGSTYTTTNDSSGQPVPTVGTDHHTIPFFATGNLSAQTDYNAGGPNVRDIEIPTGSDSVWAYFGCFLNLYDLTYQIDGKIVQAWLTGTHHCIVAQIAFSGAPINAGDTPESSDKLAQRNLQVTHSDNPGPAETHRIPQTFDIRPTDPEATAADELMIDWGTVPPGSTASIYWPQVSAADVLALAAKLHAGHGLSAADANTIRCAVTGGVTYIPIPSGTGANLAGLLTLDLPPSVKVRQEFNVVVRRIGTQQGAPPIIIRTPSSTVGLGELPARPLPVKAAETETFSWRYVVGSFQVKIPVATADQILFPEENTLAIMKWRLLQTPASNRWYPVLQRYVSSIAARVDGLGGNSGAIVPSPTGVGPRQLLVHKRVVLKIWRQGDMLTDNAHEIEWLERNGWRVAHQEKLLEDPATGTCEILFLLEREQSSFAIDDYPPPVGGGVMKPISVTVPATPPIIVPSAASIILSCSTTRGRILIRQLDPPSPATDMVIAAGPAAHAPATAAGVYTASISRAEGDPGSCLVGFFCINDADPYSPPRGPHDAKGYPEAPHAVIRVDALFIGGSIAFADAGPVAVLTNELVPAGEMRVFYVRFVNKP